MADLVKSEPELRHWTGKVEDHLYNLNLFAAIVEAVRSHPNCLQPDVKKLVGETDGRRVANLIGYLEKAGEIVRVREGRTYRLLAADSEDIPATAPPPPPVVSHRADTLPAEPHLIGFSSLDHVPLPPSPTQWDTAEAAGDTAALPETKDHFAVLDAIGLSNPSRTSRSRSGPIPPSDGCIPTIPDCWRSTTSETLREWKDSQHPRCAMTEREQWLPRPGSVTACTA